MGESTGRLTLHSSDLGSCHYELSLKATASKPEKPLYFCTTLGSNQTLTAKLMNYSRQRTEYSLQVSPACSGIGEQGQERENVMQGGPLVCFFPAVPVLIPQALLF